MYAIVETGGKQYRVEEGTLLTVEKLQGDVGSEVQIEKVLLAGQEDDIQVGQPYLDSAKITCEILEQGKGDKIVVFKHKKRKDYRKKQGHRQEFTKIKVKAIEA